MRFGAGVLDPAHGVAGAARGGRPRRGPRLRRRSGSTITCSRTRATGTTASSRAGRRSRPSPRPRRGRRLGLMVAANTFRNPGLTAKLATTLDHVSGGRAILGLGGGWFEREHDAFGIDFGTWLRRAPRPARGGGAARPAPARRRARHARGHAGTGSRTRSASRGRSSRGCRSSSAAPGRGRRIPIVARHADLWNAYGSPDELAAADAILRAACDAVGRDEREIERTFNVNVVDPRLARRGGARHGRAGSRPTCRSRARTASTRSGRSRRSRRSSTAIGRPGSTTRCSSSAARSTSRRWTGCPSCGRRSATDRARGQPASAIASASASDGAGCAASHAPTRTAAA